ncbi:MAG TPA: FxsA family protein [Solirubrobacteraceae bacterium]|jgi:UPF0716 protein FxsA
MIALLLLWPVAELFVMFEVANAIGFLYMLLLLLVSWPIGLWVMRSQGRLMWRRLQAAVAEGRRPTREVLDGALVLLGGTLLIIPGFIADVVGLVLLLPPTRALTRGLLRRNLQNRFVVRAVGATGRPSDVDSTATDVDQPRLQP